MDVARAARSWVRRRAPEYGLLVATAAAFLLSAGMLLGLVRVPS